VKEKSPIDAALMLAAQGRYEEALHSIALAISARPNEPAWHNEAGKILMKLGRPDQAIIAFRTAGQLAPQFAEAFYNLGTAHQEKKEIPQAISAYHQAIALRPNYAEAYNNLGNALLEIKDYRNAADALQHALALVPTFAPMHYNLGCVLYESAQIEASVERFRKAISIDPHLPEAWYSLGNALKDQGKYDESMAALQSALTLRPTFAQGWNSMAALHHERADYKAALVAVHRAIELKPNFAEAYANLGSTLKDQGNLDGAIAAYEKAIALQPGNPRMEWNLALVLLLKGDYERGWRLFESRPNTDLYRFDRPRWDGAALNGRTILVCLEQGFGDVIQFVRFVPRLVELGGQVIALGRPPLRRLLEGHCGICQYVGIDEPVPPFDYYTMLLSLARLFNVSLSDLSTTPYLQADVNLVERWGSRVGRAGNALRVGLVWAGNPIHSNDRNRSVPLRSMAEHLAMPGVQYYSLQKDAITADITAQAPAFEMIDLTAQIEDFADTAALISNLDLVIACDTSVAHLAGAIGKPIWILLPFAPDWRWMLGRSDSVWYPTARLFRQITPGDWSKPLAEIKKGLSDLVRQRAIQSFKGES